MTNRNPERGRESRASRDYGNEPGNERYEGRAWREREDSMPIGSRESIRDADYGRRDENEESPYRSSGRGYESGMQSQYGGMQGPQGGMQGQWQGQSGNSLQGDDFRRYGSGRGYGAEGSGAMGRYQHGGSGSGSAYGSEQGPWGGYGSGERYSQDRSAMTGQSYGSSYPGQGGYGGGQSYGQQHGGQSYGQQSGPGYGQGPMYGQGQGSMWNPGQGQMYGQGGGNYGQGYFSRPYEQSAEYAGLGGYGASARDYGSYAQTGRNYGQSYAQYGQQQQQQPQYGSYQRGAYGESYQGGAQYGSQYGSPSGARTESQRGRGPKGYTRSDDRIREDICERLTDDPYIDASDINITARDGTVTLEGRVDERWMKHRVEDLIDACPGVKQIENRLTVAGQSPSDSDTAAGKGSGATTGSQSQSTTAAKRH